MRWAHPLGVLSATLLLVGCSSSDDEGSEPAPDAMPPILTVTVTEEVTVTRDPASADDVAVPRARDWELSVRITAKKCYGDLGCNIEYELEPTYTGPLSSAELKASTFDLTYEVVGGDSGPIIDTVSVEEGRVYGDLSGRVSIDSPTVELRARVTDVY